MRPGTLFSLGVIALGLLLAGMFSSGTAAPWLMASGYAVWVGALVVGRRLFDTAIWRTLIAIGAFLGVASLFPAFGLARPMPIILAGGGLLVVIVITGLVRRASASR